MSKIEKDLNEDDEVIYKIYKTDFTPISEEGEEPEEDAELKSYLIIGQNENISACEIKEGVLQSKNGNLGFEALDYNAPTVVNADKPEGFDGVPQKLKI